jgi:hypothetical protein
MNRARALDSHSARARRGARGARTPFRVMFDRSARPIRRPLGRGFIHRLGVRLLVFDCFEAVVDRTEFRERPGDIIRLVFELAFEVIDPVGLLLDDLLQIVDDLNECFYVCAVCSVGDFGHGWLTKPRLIKDKLLAVCRRKPKRSIPGFRGVDVPVALLIVLT